MTSPAVATSCEPAGASGFVETVERGAVSLIRGPHVFALALVGAANLEGVGGSGISQAAGVRGRAEPGYPPRPVYDNGACARGLRKPPRGSFRGLLHGSSVEIRALAQACNGE